MYITFVPWFVIWTLANKQTVYKAGGQSLTWSFHVGVLQPQLCTKQTWNNRSCVFLRSCLQVRSKRDFSSLKSSCILRVWSTSCSFSSSSRQVLHCFDCSFTLLCFVRALLSWIHPFNHVKQNRLMQLSESQLSQTRTFKCCTHIAGMHDD